MHFIKQSRSILIIIITTFPQAAKIHLLLLISVPFDLSDPPEIPTRSIYMYIIAGNPDHSNHVDAAGTAVKDISSEITFARMAASQLLFTTSAELNLHTPELIYCTLCMHVCLSVRLQSEGISAYRQRQEIKLIYTAFIEGAGKLL